jgi:hypothetical protein
MKGTKNVVRSKQNKETERKKEKTKEKQISVRIK